MDILLWVVFGLVVGIVAKLIMPGADPGGIVVTIVLGIVGALLGGWIGRVMGLYHEGEAAGFIMAVIRAAIVLALHRLGVSPRTPQHAREAGDIPRLPEPIADPRRPQPPDPTHPASRPPPAGR